MEITLKNIGCINSATVKLTGLNVIAGPNGTGKSSIGKTVYTIIKSVSNCNKIVSVYKKNLMETLAKNIFYSIQNNLNSKVPKDEAELLYNFTKKIFLDKLIYLLDNKNYSDAQNLISNNIKLVNSFKNLDYKTKSSVKNSLDILLEQTQPYEQDKAIKKALEFMYQSIFKEQINNLGSHKTSEVTLDINTNIFSYSVSNNSEILPFTKRLAINKLSKNFVQSIFPQVTFIETPLVLQLSNVNNLPIYWKDLIDKLKIDGSFSDSADVCNFVYQEISSIIGGELTYNTDKQDFFFIPKNTTNKLYVNNMASGEKMFGILQKMAKLGILSPSHLLIFDEPENHLHPQWQVKLAEILTTLVEHNIPVLLTTHSATLINALQSFSEKKELSKKTNFYFADEKNKTIRNVKLIKSKEIDIIFESFYKAKELLPDM